MSQLGPQVKVAIGVSVTILVLLALGATVFYVFRRNSGDRHSEKNIDNLDYRGIENTFAGHASETLPIVQTAHSSSLVHPPIYNLHKTYVDPHTYEDPQVWNNVFRCHCHCRGSSSALAIHYSLSPF